MRGDVPTLDGWRGVAILLVLFEHAVSCTLRPAGWSELGSHGVEIFFVLSGFLITGKLLEDPSFKRFYARRAFRILPVLFAFLGVVSVLGFLLRRIPLTRSEFATSLLFVRNYPVFPLLKNNGTGWFTGHLWSLSIEEQFYLIWPLLLLKIGKRSLSKQMGALACLSGLFCVIVAAVYVGRAMHLGGWYWRPHLTFDGLLVGCGLRLTFTHSGAKQKLSQSFSGLSFVLFACTCAYFLLFRAKVTPLDPLFCGLAVCSTLVEPNGIIGRFLETPILRWIGRLSYSLYIWQQLFLGFGVVFRPFGSLSAPWVGILSAVALACISYYLLEKPLIRWGHHITSSSTGTLYFSLQPESVRNEEARA